MSIRGLYGFDGSAYQQKVHLEIRLNTAKTVTLYNEYEGIYREVKGLTLVPYDIPISCVATYFPECNPLIPLSQTAKKSNTPASKSIKIKIKQA